MSISSSYRRFSKYIHNSAWIVGEKAAGLGLAFVATVFVARYLGPEQFGSLAYALSLASIFAAAGHMGLSGLVVRDIVKYPDWRQETLGTTAALKFTGLALGYVALVGYAYFFEGPDSIEFTLIFISGAALLLKPAEVFEFWFQAFVQARYISVARLVSHIVSASFRLILVVSGAGLVMFALTPVLQGLVVLALLLLFFRSKSEIGVSQLRFEWTRARSLISQGWIVFLGSLFAIIYLKIDQVMLRWLAGPAAVGEYAVAAQFSEALYFLPVAIVASLFPKLIELRQESEARFYSRLQQVFDLLFLSGLAVAVTISFVAGWMVVCLFGDAYSGSVGILVIHVWSAIFVFMRAAVSKWILIEGALYFSLLTQGFGAFSNVVLNYLWIPKYGGIGAAYATLCSYAIASFISLLIYRRTRRVFWLMCLAIASPVRYPAAFLARSST